MLCALLSEETKGSACVMLIGHHLEFASAVWDPSQPFQIIKVEAVQR